MPAKHRRSSQHKPTQTLPSIDSPVEILRYSDECRGIATLKGKTVFVRNALLGETVHLRLEIAHKRFDEADTTDVVHKSEDRVEPVCRHYGQCGGCDLQHLNPTKAPVIKQELVLGMLKRTAQVTPEQIDPPINSAPTGYRRSARIGINQRQRDGELLTGFRRRQSAKLLNIDTCPVLDIRLDQLFNSLHEQLAGLDGVKHITEVQVTLGDESGSLKFRVTKPTTAAMKQAFIEVAERLKLTAWVEDSSGQISLLSNSSDLSFRPDSSTLLSFKPGDFLQVNADVNRQMIARAKEWLDPHKDETLLDLFCGLGNFSLPLARHYHQVIGVEGSAEMVTRATFNAEQNQLDNTCFYCTDLSQPIKDTAWYRQHNPEIILLDPPRTGAAELIPQLLTLKPKKILYIACNPSALARDSKALIEAGFKLTRFSVLDMFPNTAHIESMALFEAKK